MSNSEKNSKRWQSGKFGDVELQLEKLRTIEHVFWETLSGFIQKIKQ